MKRWSKDGQKMEKRWSKDGQKMVLVTTLDSVLFPLTLRRLISYIYIYIYMEHPFLMFLDHTRRRSTVGRTPLDE